MVTLLRVKNHHGKKLTEIAFENAFIKIRIIRSELEYKPNFAIVLYKLS